MLLPPFYKANKWQVNYVCTKSTRLPLTSKTRIWPKNRNIALIASSGAWGKSLGFPPALLQLRAEQRETWAKSQVGESLWAASCRRPFPFPHPSVHGGVAALWIRGGSSVLYTAGTLLSHSTTLCFWSNSARHLKTWGRLEHVNNAAEKHRDCCRAFSALLNRAWQGIRRRAVKCHCPFC